MISRLFVAASAAVMLGGCGHPATVEECETIVERVVLLQLKQQRPGMSAEDAQRELVAEREASREAMMKRCVGRRVTDGIMQCVREAESADEVIDGCLD